MYIFYKIKIIWDVRFNAALFLFYSMILLVDGSYAGECVLINRR